MRQKQTSYISAMKWGQADMECTQGDEKREEIKADTEKRDRKERNRMKIRQNSYI
jgi:hypothetical protein